MTAFFITIEGLFWVFAGFAVYVLVLVFLGFLGVLWVLRPGWRRAAGGLLLAGLAAFGAGPTLYETIRGNRLGALMAEASFWPEDVQFEGARVLIVGGRWRSCGNLCRTLLERGDVAELYIVGLTDAAMGAPLTVQTLRDPDTTVQRASLETVGEDTIGRGVIVPMARDAPLPETADWVFVVDGQGRHAAAYSDAIGLAPERFEQVGRALHLYEVQGARLSPTLEVTAVARMMTGWRIRRPLFLPMVSNTEFANDTTPFSDALETWICGPITESWEDRCPYLF